MFLGERKGGLQWFEKRARKMDSLCTKGKAIKLGVKSLRKVRFLTERLQPSHASQYPNPSTYLGNRTTTLHLIETASKVEPLSSSRSRNK